MFVGDRISNWRPLNCCTKICEVVSKNCITTIFIYICHISHIPWNPENLIQISEKTSKNILVLKIGLFIVEKPRLLRSYLFFNKNVLGMFLNFVSKHRMFLFIWPVYFIWNICFAIALTNFKFILTNELICCCLVMNNKASPVNVHTSKLCSYLSVHECI